MQVLVSRFSHLVGLILLCLCLSSRSRGAVDFYKFLGIKGFTLGSVAKDLFPELPQAKIRGFPFVDEWGNHYHLLIGDEKVLQSWVAFAQLYAAIGIPYVPFWPTVVPLNANGEFCKEGEEVVQWRSAVVRPTRISAKEEADGIRSTASEFVYDIASITVGLGVLTGTITSTDAGSLGHPLQPFEYAKDATQKADVRSFVASIFHLNPYLRQRLKNYPISAYPNLSEELGRFFDKFEAVMEHNLDSAVGPILYDENYPRLTQGGHDQRLLRFGSMWKRLRPAVLSVIKDRLNHPLQFKMPEPNPGGVPRSIMPKVRFANAFALGGLDNLPSLEDPAFVKKNARHLLYFYFFYPVHRREPLIEKWKRETQLADPLNYLVNLATDEDGTIRWVYPSAENIRIEQQPFLNEGLEPTLLVLGHKDTESIWARRLAETVAEKGVPLRVMNNKDEGGKDLTVSDAENIVKLAKWGKETQVLLWEPRIPKDQRQAVLQVFETAGIKLKILDHHASTLDGEGTHRLSSLEQLADATGYLLGMQERVAALIDRGGVYSLRHLDLTDAQRDSVVHHIRNNSRVHELYTMFNHLVQQQGTAIALSNYSGSLNHVTSASDFQSLPNLNTLLMLNGRMFRIRGHASDVDRVLNLIPRGGDFDINIGGDRGSVKYASVFTTRDAAQRLFEKAKSSFPGCAELVIER